MSSPLEEITVDVQLLCMFCYLFPQRLIMQCNKTKSHYTLPVKSSRLVRFFKVNRRRRKRRWNQCLFLFTMLLSYSMLQSNRCLLASLRVTSALDEKDNSMLPCVAYIKALCLYFNSESTQGLQNTGGMLFLDFHGCQVISDVIVLVKLAPKGKHDF